MLTEQVSSQVRIYKQFMSQQQDKDFIRVIERRGISPDPSLYGDPHGARSFDLGPEFCSPIIYRVSGLQK
jgi:hypothetical protein